MRRAGLVFGFLGVNGCGLIRPWCHCCRLCFRCGPGDGGGAWVHVHLTTHVCLIDVNIIFLILLSESVVDLDCCVDLQKHIN